MKFETIIPVILMGVVFGFVYFYSKKDQWGRFDKRYSEKHISNFIYGFIFGSFAAVVLFFLDWPILILSVIPFAGLATWIYSKRLKKIWRHALLLGIFLMAFDWVFENMGAHFGYWFSKNSAFFVLAVPIEVMIAALLGGYAYALFLPKKFDIKYLLIIALLPAIGGPLGEAQLQSIGRMTYGNGWNWPHAVIGYFLTWIFLDLVWYKILKRKEGLN